MSQGKHGRLVAPYATQREFRQERDKFWQTADFAYNRYLGTMVLYQDFYKITLLKTADSSCFALLGLISAAQNTEACAYAMK